MAPGAKAMAFSMASHPSHVAHCPNRDLASTPSAWSLFLTVTTRKPLTAESRAHLPRGPTTVQSLQEARRWAWRRASFQRQVEAEGRARKKKARSLWWGKGGNAGLVHKPTGLHDGQRGGRDVDGEEGMGSDGRFPMWGETLVHGGREFPTTERWMREVQPPRLLEGRDVDGDDHTMPCISRRLPPPSPPPTPNAGTEKSFFFFF
ncbi:hypothetical protein TIFTF001_024801 [Ficus carica]|uniref:Uncharacterized protein n=1 Tax=Ficus carica TaxID=3494 RepID=A0AA88AIK7_FICCA|nr:hypothetical protein TIFTF001_024801 [Ficus carica]